MGDMAKGRVGSEVMAVATVGNKVNHTVVPFCRWRRAQRGQVTHQRSQTQDSKPHDLTQHPPPADPPLPDFVF